MNIDWDKFREEAHAAAAEAGRATNETLSGRIAAVSRFSEAEIREMFPDAADAEKVAALIAVVKDTTLHNEKVVALQRNISQWAGVLVTLLQKAV